MSERDVPVFLNETRVGTARVQTRAGVHVVSRIDPVPGGPAIPPVEFAEPLPDVATAAAAFTAAGR